MEPYREEPKKTEGTVAVWNMGERSGLFCNPGFSSTHLLASRVSNSGNSNMDNSIIKLPQDKAK
jgi:hypothetical protein